MHYDLISCPGVAFACEGFQKCDLGGFYMAVGISGNQYKNNPIEGCMMAELIDACEKGLDHDKSPFQLTIKYTGHKVDVGFFSRKREVDYNSSFSVNGWAWILAIPIGIKSKKGPPLSDFPCGWPYILTTR